MARLIKGYANDAGMDVVLDEYVVFPPHSTKIVNLGKLIEHVISDECGIICARTSAAKRGLVIANCPIDPDYTGDWHAIVHNVSDVSVMYSPGEAFCQVVLLKITNVLVDTTFCKKQGKRSDSNFGQTDKE